MIDKTITLIRHGKTSGNYEKRYVGITDEQMTMEGEREIHIRKYPEADIVFSSPLVRCVRTAKIIYPGKDIILIDDLRETNFGLFEGKNYKELSGNPDYQAWIDGGGVDAFPGGESREDASKRSLRGFYSLIQQAADYTNISVICHGGTIMAILSQLFGGDYYSYHIENSEGFTFDLSSDGVYSGLHPRSFLR
jgi:alpha-ribazole phosphatase